MLARWPGSALPVGCWPTVFSRLRATSEGRDEAKIFPSAGLHGMRVGWPGTNPSDRPLRDDSSVPSDSVIRAPHPIECSKGASVRRHKLRHRPRIGKARSVEPPPAGVDLRHLAGLCRYVGSPYHKDIPWFGGAPTAPRPHASICPRELARKQALVEGWLRDAIRAGQVGGWDHGFPRYVWYRDEGTVYEARQGSPSSGAYHGYPLEEREYPRGLK